MKVYFSTSIGQMTPETHASALRILAYLKSKGHRIVSADYEQTVKYASKIRQQTEEEALLVQKNLARLRKQADIVIFEVSQPSFAVGQEINIALSLNKPVIALYQDGTTPHLLRDEAGDLLLLTSYNDRNLEDVLKDAIEYSQANQDVRFNFFISPIIGRYLDWIARTKMIPRSVYLRSLIEDDMAKSSEYSDQR
jgi:hypothetical protein